MSDNVAYQKETAASSTSKISYKRIVAGDCIAISPEFTARVSDVKRVGENCQLLLSDVQLSNGEVVLADGEVSVQLTVRATSRVKRVGLSEQEREAIAQASTEQLTEVLANRSTDDQSEAAVTILSKLNPDQLTTEQRSQLAKVFFPNGMATKNDTK